MSSDAQRVVRTEVPQEVAVAILALAQRSLAGDPRRVGTPLGGADDGLWIVRRREFTLRLEIDDADRIVRIVLIRSLPDNRLR